MGTLIIEFYYGLHIIRPWSIEKLDAVGILVACHSMGRYRYIRMVSNGSDPLENP